MASSAAVTVAASPVTVSVEPSPAQPVSTSGAARGQMMPPAPMTPRQTVLVYILMILMAGMFRRGLLQIET